jgi:hypothetical protein
VTERSEGTGRHGPVVTGPVGGRSVTRPGVAPVSGRFGGGPARSALTAAVALDPHAYTHTDITSTPDVHHTSVTGPAEELP